MTKQELTLTLAQADAVIRWLSFSPMVRATQGPEFAALVSKWRDESNARYLTYPQGK